MSEPFKKQLERRGNGSMKWEKAYIEKRFKIQDDTDIYPLFIADMDYEMDENIKQKMLETLEQPDFGYYHIQDGFYESVVKWQKKVHHMEVKKEWILPSIGTVTSMNIICDIYAKNQSMMILTPVYGPFQKCCNVGNCVTLPLIENTSTYEIDFIKMESIFKQQDIKILLFCNPHNPSGRVWTYEELKRLVMICKEYNVRLLVDEIHSDIIISDKVFISLFSFCDMYDQIMISTSANKTFNISGLSTSYVLCKNNRILEDIQAYFDRLHISCNRMGIMMSEYVYTYGYTWYTELVKKIKQNMELVYSYLDASDIEYMKADSGYLIWIRLSQVSDVDQFVLDVAKHTHVLLETGSRFVENYDGWIRINVATTTDRLEEAMKRFITYYKQRISK